MNTAAGAKKWILTSMVIAATIAVLTDLSQGEIPKLRIIFGAFFATILLTLLAEVQPEIAAGLAVIALTYSLISHDSIFPKLAGWFD